MSDISNLRFGDKLLRTLQLSATASGMYYGIQWDTAPGQFERLQKHGLVTCDQPHNLSHKARAVITEKGKAVLAAHLKPVPKPQKPEYFQTPKKQRVTANEILELWDENEQTMGEQAALAVACDMLQIELEDAYDIIASAPQRKEA